MELLRMIFFASLTLGILAITFSIYFIKRNNKPLPLKSFTDTKKRRLGIVWTSERTYADEEKLYIKVWLPRSSDYAIQIGQEPLSFIQDSFKKEEVDYWNKATAKYIVRAYNGEKLIGFVSFISMDGIDTIHKSENHKNDEILWILNSVVDDEYQNAGIWTFLYHDAFNQLPRLRTLLSFVSEPCLNKVITKGFSVVDYSNSHYDASYWKAVKFERQNTSKKTV